MRFIVLVAVRDWEPGGPLYPFDAEVVERGDEWATRWRQRSLGEGVGRFEEGRKGSVKVHRGAVRKVSTKGPIRFVPSTFKLTLPPRTALRLTR